MANSKSPYNLYFQGSSRTVKLKSMIFTNNSSTQVRILIEVTDLMNMKMDKIVSIEFDFQNIEMNDEERLINPLGFRVKLYRIEDERIQ
ncbi:MAG: type IV secretion system protein [Candidatus Midichloria sp.]|nr:MAG: type IV secretion system protein [Candidatus Midichloria sp.]